MSLKLKKKTTTNASAPITLEKQTKIYKISLKYYYCLYNCERRIISDKQFCEFPSLCLLVCLFLFFCLKF